jgi:hypothetical protein
LYGLSGGKIAERCHASEKNVCAFLAAERSKRENFFLHFIHLNILILIFYVPSSRLSYSREQTNARKWGEGLSIFYDGHFFSLINSSSILSTRDDEETTKSFFQDFLSCLNSGGDERQCNAMCVYTPQFSCFFFHCLLNFDRFLLMKEENVARFVLKKISE